MQPAKTQLVVLSACETGIGDFIGNKGVYGLQRAFKQAGAEYLLMSLWKVPDNETEEFMTTFYNYYFGGRSIEEAYQLTQKTMAISTGAIPTSGRRLCWFVNLIDGCFSGIL